LKLDHYIVAVEFLERAKSDMFFALIARLDAPADHY